MGPDGTIERIESGEGQAILRLAGEIDMSNVKELRTAIQGCLSEGCRHITLDMAGVRFIDSSGVAVLMETHRSLRECGDVTVSNPSHSVRHVLKLTALDQIIKVVPETE